MTASRRFRPLVVLLAVVPLAGCGTLFKTTCAQPGDFAAAPNNPPLRVPAGLNAPGTRSALPIPDLATPERPRQASEGCLDAPPKFVAPTPSPPAA